jgi:hypothetical protein
VKLEAEMEEIGKAIKALEAELVALGRELAVYTCKLLGQRSADEKAEFTPGQGEGAAARWDEAAERAVDQAAREGARSAEETRWDLFTAAAGVLEWMDSVGRKFRFPRRVNAFDPGPRFADEDFGEGVVWDREQVVSVAVDYFRQSLDVLPGSTQGNGVCATLASRGCGKSFVVDFLCRLHDKNVDSNLVLGEQLNARLVPVCISFNGPQDVEADRDESAQVQLLSRLAHRAFFNVRRG